MAEIEFLVCKSCDTPCYMFELDKKGQVVSAFCQVCGNDDPVDFEIGISAEDEEDQ